MGPEAQASMEYGRSAPLAPISARWESLEDGWQAFAGDADDPWWNDDVQLELVPVSQAVAEIVNDGGSGAVGSGWGSDSAVDPPCAGHPVEHFRTIDEVPQCQAGSGRGSCQFLRLRFHRSSRSA
jgi:hypothetical protein